MTANSRHTFDLPDPANRDDVYEGVNFKRGAAWGIDMVVILAISLLVLPFTAFTGLFYFPFLLLATGFLYRWGSIAGGSATWGMRLMAIELREADGSRLSGQTALLHTLGYTISVAVFPLQAISVLMMLLGDRNQGLSDHILGTVAVNRLI